MRPASPSGSASPHYVLDYESRFRTEVIEDFAEFVPPGRDAGAVHPLQPADQVSRPARDGARPRRCRAGDRALCAPGGRPRRDRNCTAPATPRATRAISCSQRREPNSISCAFRWAGWPRTRPARWRGDFGLAVADKPDSQDICFVPQGSYAGLVERLRPEAAEPGEIVDRGAACSADHRGIAHFTVGQRKGLGIAAAQPLHVLRDRAREAARCRRAAGGLGRNADFAGRTQLARCRIRRAGRASELPPSCVRRSRRCRRRFIPAPRPARLSWFSPPRRMRWRPARPRFFTMASGCSAAAGSAGGAAA